MAEPGEIEEEATAAPVPAAEEREAVLARLRASRAALVASAPPESTAAARALAGMKRSPAVSALEMTSVSKLLAGSVATDFLKGFSASSVVGSVLQPRDDILAFSRSPAVASLVETRASFQKSIAGLVGIADHAPWKSLYTARETILQVTAPLGRSLSQSVLQLHDVSKQLAGFRAGLVAPIFEDDRWRSLLRGTSEFATQLVEWNRLEQEVEQGADAFVRAHQWPIPMVLPLRLRLRLVRSRDQLQTEQVEALLLRACAPGSEALDELWLALAEADIMESRRHIIDEAYAAYRNGLYHAAIYTLLPQIEGVMLDASFDPESRPSHKRPQKAVTRLAPQRGFSEVLFRGLLMVAELAGDARPALFAQYDPYHYTFEGEPEGVNRHAILHGDARRFGTAANALWVLLVLVSIVEHVEMDRLRTVDVAQA